MVPKLFVFSFFFYLFIYLFFIYFFFFFHFQGLSCELENARVLFKTFFFSVNTKYRIRSN